MADLEGKAGTTSNTTGSSAGGESAGKGLERFAGSDGKVDASKLGTSYLELEKAHRDQGEKLSALDKSYKTLAVRIEAGVAPKAPVAAPKPEEEFSRLATDTRGYVEGVAGETVSGATSGIKLAILELAHPELKDPEFIKGMQEFTKTLPPAIQASVEDYGTADWIVRSYKAGLNGGGEAEGGAGEPAVKPNFSERPGAGKRPAATGKIWTRGEIRTVMKNKTEYAKVADDIARAYEEGRVRV